MYWSSNGITYIEGHNTPGVNAEALKWAFAEGAEGRVDESNIPYSSFFLVSNASGNALDLKATFVREDGTGIVKTFTVPAQSRFTIPTGSYPELRHQRFAAFLESTNNLPFVAERAVYWGEGFYGGHASVGTPWTEAIGTPPVATLTPTIATITPNTGTVAGGTVVTITGTNFVDPLTGTGHGHARAVRHARRDVGDGDQLDDADGDDARGAGRWRGRRRGVESSHQSGVGAGDVDGRVHLHGRSGAASAAAAESAVAAGRAARRSSSGPTSVRTCSRGSAKRA